MNQKAYEHLFILNLMTLRITHNLLIYIFSNLAWQWFFGDVGVSDAVPALAGFGPLWTNVHLLLAMCRMCGFHFKMPALEPLTSSRAGHGPKQGPKIGPCYILSHPILSAWNYYRFFSTFGCNCCLIGIWTPLRGSRLPPDPHPGADQYPHPRASETPGIIISEMGSKC